MEPQISDLLGVLCPRPPTLKKICATVIPSLGRKTTESHSLVWKRRRESSGVGTGDHGEKAINHSLSFIPGFLNLVNSCYFIELWRRSQTWLRSSAAVAVA